MSLASNKVFAHLEFWKFVTRLPKGEETGLTSELRDIRKEIEDSCARPQSSISGPVQEAVSGDLIVSSPERQKSSLP